MSGAPRALMVVGLLALAGCAPVRSVWQKIRPSSATPESTASAPTPVAKTGGTLLLSGGTRTAGALIAEAARMMAGAPAKVLVVPVASARGDGGKTDVDTWRKAGFSDVEMLDAADAAHAAAQIDEATFIWMTGLEPSRLIDQLVASGASSRIRARFDAGAVVGGTNAGASAVAELMLLGGSDDAEMQTGRVPTVGGLALWRGVIVDEHFVSKKRFNKLMAAVIDHPQFVGVGIDEATGVVFDGTSIRVVGEGNVVVIDARRATISPSRPGDASAATGVEMQVLAGGMSYELPRR
jgi:cyanophycinase